MNQNIKIVDVRSHEEFQSGHVAGSVNIPLDELNDRLDEVRSIKNKIVLCCASGRRSHIAYRFLHEKGIDCEDGGSWVDVNILYVFES